MNATRPLLSEQLLRQDALTPGTASGGTVLE